MATSEDYLDDEIRLNQDWEFPEFYSNMEGCFDFLFKDREFAYLNILADKPYFEKFRKALIQYPFTEQFDIPYVGLESSTLLDCVNYI